MSELRALDPVDEPDDDSESAGDADESGASRLTALRHRLRPSGRLLAAVAGVVVLAGWSAMMWSLVTSMAAIDESIEVIALQIAEQEAGTEPAALDSTPAEPDAAAAPVFSPMFEAMFEFDADAETMPAPAATSEPTPEPTPAFPATLLGKAVVTDGADLWNCTDFESWEQAQMVYEANLPDDPNILDFDANGTPCDSLLTTGRSN